MSGARPPGQERGDVPLAHKVEFLEQPESYPETTSAVRAVETHMSWVFVGDRLVYKMKKPVQLPFLDFSTLARRHHFCLESLRLNRRLAPSVYLGVIPLTLEEDGGLAVDGTGGPVEWLEKMHRLPEERMLDRAIELGTVTEVDVQRFTRVLSGFYRDATPVRMTPMTFRQRLEGHMDRNRTALGAPGLGIDRSRLERVLSAQQSFLTDHRHLFDARVAAGRVIEAHGDLRPEHVALLDEPVFIDCLEFNRGLRVMDVAEELSYLAMECAVAGAPFIEAPLFETYETVTGDRIPAALIGFYQSHRALIRARLAVGHLPDYPRDTHAQWLAQAADYVSTAERGMTTVGAISRSRHP